MSNIKLAISLTLFSLCSMSFASQTLDENGLPLPGSGVTVAPLKEIGFTEKEINRELKRKKQMEAQGFVNNNKAKAQRLLAMKYNEKSILKKVRAASKDPSDTDIKSSIEDVHLAFPYKIHDIGETIGYAAGGKLTDKGWSSVVHFFKSEKLGICQFELANVTISEGAIAIGSEVIRYDVSNKPTVLGVEGNDTNGYLYRVGWYDKQYHSELECASKTFSQQITQDLISLANEIDQMLS